MFRNPLEEQGGEGRGLSAPRALRFSPKKKALSDGCDGQELTATTICLRVERVCNGKRIVHSSRDPKKPQMLAHNRLACPSMW